jgi:hypothetical protein
VVQDELLRTASQRAKCVLPDTVRQAKPPAGKNWPLARQTKEAGAGLGIGPPGQWSRTSFQDRTLPFTSQRAKWLASPVAKQAYCPRSNLSMLAMHTASAHAGAVMPASTKAAANAVLLFNSSVPWLTADLSHCAIVAR